MVTCGCGRVYVPILVVTQTFDIGTSATKIPVGRGSLFLIAGPCVLESQSHARMLAEAIQAVTADLEMPCIFKASYDKANRTSINSFARAGTCRRLPDFEGHC